MNHLLYLPRRIAQLLIRFYQKTISPDHSWLRHRFPGGFCRFTPSCSAYSHTAIGRYGLIKGGLKGLWRIIRCNPWSKGGIDLP
ncbi:membrane protein insertion efficiency factor YidD [Patescibacteria group bacterium]|nr:membrane protein insertion efficiency factor YidD [Patescibacteria group bacterium]